jgi:hypothetical protein
MRRVEFGHAKLSMGSSLLKRTIILYLHSFLMNRFFCLIGIYPLNKDHVGLMDSPRLGEASIKG